MAGPTRTFKYAVRLSPLNNKYYVETGAGTVYNNSGKGYVVTDTYDGIGDNTAVLGDVANDHFSVTGGQATVTGTYIAKQTGGDGSGFIAHTPSGSYLYTNDPSYGASSGSISKAAGKSVGFVKDIPGTTPADMATQEAICFVAGTLIRTARGDVAIEALAVGDEVVTSRGETRPIRWLGHRTIDCRRNPRPHGVLPIRVAAQAFGPDKPARDLYVSSGHSICIDMLGEVLVPASALINGTTIRQVAVDEITYWHVELDSHDIILAENLPTESYIEMGNRSFFQENGVTTLDAVPEADAATRTHADFCRPFHPDGPLVHAARLQLQGRALDAGWTLDANDPFAGLHLVVDDVRIEPIRRGLAARFAVPAGARDIWLVSTTSRPCEIGDSDDGRDLGVCVGRLTIDDGFAPPRDIDLADPLVCVGFHHLEDDVRRWTAGRAQIPAELCADCPDGFFLRVELASAALPRWIEPASMPAAARPKLVCLSA